MIADSLIKARLEAETSYTIEYSRTKQPELAELTDLPIIYIGYTAIDSKNPTSPVEHDFLDMHGEDLVQTFDISIVTTRDQLPIIWKTLYQSLIGWNPSPNDLSTSMTYGQGGLIGIENGRLWWLDRWRVGFPTTNVIV